MVEPAGFLFHLFPEEAEFLLETLRRILRQHGELRHPIGQLASQTGTEPVDRGLKESLRGAHHKSGAMAHCGRSGQGWWGFDGALGRRWGALLRGKGGWR